MMFSLDSRMVEYVRKPTHGWNWQIILAWIEHVCNHHRISDRHLKSERSSCKGKMGTSQLSESLPTSLKLQTASTRANIEHMTKHGIQTRSNFLRGLAMFCSVTDVFWSVADCVIRMQRVKNLHQKAKRLLYLNCWTRASVLTFGYNVFWCESWPRMVLNMQPREILTNFTPTPKRVKMSITHYHLNRTRSLKIPSLSSWKSSFDDVSKHIYIINPFPNQR